MKLEKKRTYIRGHPDFKKNGKWIKTFCETTEDKYIYHYTRSFCLWNDMEARCQEGGPIQKLRRYYDGSKNLFESYDYFASWCQSQEGYMEKVKDRFYQLDKDLLIQGNKFYSESSCLFVPAQINSLFLTGVHRDRELPMGVGINAKTGLYDAHGKKLDGGSRTLGTNQKTPQEAHRLWQANKIWNIEMTLLEYPNLSAKVVDAVTARLDKIKYQYVNFEETKH